MKDPIKLIKLGWKTGLISLSVTTMFLGGLVLNLNAIGATGDAQQTAPSLFITHLGTNISEPPAGDWSHSVSADDGDFVQLYTEVGTHVATPAGNVTVKFDLPTSLATGGQSTAIATSSTSGVDERSDGVTWDYRGGATCSLAYVGGSASARVDRDRDGNPESDGPISDNIVGSGVDFGTFTDGVVQVTFKARVECLSEQPSPTPTPTPIPSPTPEPSPTPPAGGQEQEQNQEVNVNVNQNNNQTVNITNPAPPVVAGAKVPVKQPATGAGVLGLVGMAGAAPIGVALTRFGRGRTVGKREEENLGEFANGVNENRFGKKNDA